MNLFIDFWEDLLWSIGTAFVLIVLIYILMIVISIGIGILQLISMWKLYEKAGEPNWSSIVPVYNYIQMIKIATGDYKLVWVYLAIIVMYTFLAITINSAGGINEIVGSATSFVSLFMALLMTFTYMGILAIAGCISYMFPKSYGKSEAFCVLSIFFFPIMVIIMGFDKSIEYVGPRGIPKNKF